jgi:hypothetical protein
MPMPALVSSMPMPSYALDEPVCVLSNHQWAWSIDLTRFTTMVVAYFL